MTPEEFIEWLKPAAEAQCACYGLPASVLIAQGAIESGWGAYKIGEFNIFGRKAVDGDKSISVWTKEYGNESAYDQDEQHVYLGNNWWNIVADFKDYDNLLQACDDWCILMTQEKAYAEAVGVWYETKDIEQFVNLMAPVYATGPTYAADILSTIRANEL